MKRRCLAILNVPKRDCIPELYFLYPRLAAGCCEIPLVECSRRRINVSFNKQEDSCQVLSFIHKKKATCICRWLKNSSLENKKAFRANSWSFRISSVKNHGDQSLNIVNSHYTKFSPGVPFRVAYISNSWMLFAIVVLYCREKAP